MSRARRDGGSRGHRGCRTGGGPVRVLKSMLQPSTPQRTLQGPSCQGAPLQARHRHSLLSFGLRCSEGSGTLTRRRRRALGTARVPEWAPYPRPGGGFAQNPPGNRATFRSMKKGSHLEKKPHRARGQDDSGLPVMPRATAGTWGEEPARAEGWTARYWDPGSEGHVLRITWAAPAHIYKTHTTAPQPRHHP